MATGNRHKVGEIARILGSRFRVLGLDSLGKVPRIVESGRTFDANASIKARCVRDVLLRMKNPPAIDFVIADDSGLQVKALRGAPGIRSARYAGARANDSANRKKLLRRMENKKNRSAAFQCALAMAPLCSKKIIRFRGTVRGRITREEKGRGGFGYDPVFVPVCHRRTFGELNMMTKNRMSHRFRALQKMKSWLAKNRRR